MFCPGLLPLTWPAVKLLLLCPPPPSASSHPPHNYRRSDGVIITAAIKPGFRSAAVFQAADQKSVSSLSSSLCCTVTPDTGHAQGASSCMLTCRVAVVSAAMSKTCIE
ncbi:hypothetical protein CgunFtcFv8_005011 [Champsocephalus gunnari]|uniref:Secreted protein n=1 Tax=Champsocephalus gunnari TaxID=52237 RepID=A0AAN8HCP6_CHAGU|nr:hypothetical protein CgunFtcFv8_005011 [Champsocephalus gunnari]